MVICWLTILTYSPYPSEKMQFSVQKMCNVMFQEKMFHSNDVIIEVTAQLHFL